MFTELGVLEKLQGQWVVTFICPVLLSVMKTDQEFKVL